MKELMIEIPNGYVVDEENSNLLQGVIKFKKIKIKTFDDLVKSKQKVNGCWIDGDSELLDYGYIELYETEKNVFADKKHAKSALAMAQISQLMPYYGGAITDEEWGYTSKNKYVIGRIANRINKDILNSSYCLLAFHTRELRDEFLKNNVQLVKDYLMID